MLLFNTINELKIKWTYVNILFTIKQAQKNLFVLFFLFFVSAIQLSNAAFGIFSNNFIIHFTCFLIACFPIK